MARGRKKNRRWHGAIAQQGSGDPELQNRPVVIVAGKYLLDS